MTGPNGTDIYEVCPFCGTEKLPSRIGTHLYEEHWEELGVQGGDSSTNDSENPEPLHTVTLDDGYVYVPREIIEKFELEDDGLVRWFLSDDGEVSIEFDHQRYGVFDDDEMTAPMGGDGQETHDLAGAERSLLELAGILSDEESDALRDAIDERRERQSQDIEDSDFSAGFGRWKDRDTDDLYKECPICGSEVYRGKVGGHLDKHWDEIVELVENQ